MRQALLIVMLAGSPALADHELLDRDIYAGQTLYQQHCAACHGSDLEGQPNWRSPNDDGTLPAPPHDETGHTWHHDNLLLFEYTKLGGRGALAARGMDDFNSGMPAFDGVITDDEIWDILGYIRSTWSERVQEMQASRNPPD
ncbi:c-type cytochrome [uncultured Roseobacter sp.]|uniref:c-type cytochrome n=1 Tax=uncultured Roseobacter sp. TaxID=114847 RepID=UPI00262B0ECB|nr:c-type cytochrome [uncultured Roseobacter sp.]